VRARCRAPSSSRRGCRCSADNVRPCSPRGSGREDVAGTPKSSITMLSVPWLAEFTCTCISGSFGLKKPSPQGNRRSHNPRHNSLMPTALSTDRSRPQALIRQPRSGPLEQRGSQTDRGAAQCNARFRALGLIRTFSGNGGPCSCWPQKIRPTPVPYPRSSFRPFWGAGGSARFGRQSTCRLPPSPRPASYSRYCG
jgi:hypothetical protein